MDPASYSDVRTSRGTIYHYYLCAPQDPSKPTILFLHGFPLTSYDWHRQVDFFKKQGYGLIVPDLLGYGGTDKPTKAEAYRMSLMVQDVMDILDYEKIQYVIGIGHDWGGAFLSRIAYYHSERFIAFGFLAAPYLPPDPGYDFKKMLIMTEKVFGYPIFGYWEFFGSEDAPKIIEEHLDSFYSLLFPYDPLVWRVHFAPAGKAAEWVSSNKIEKMAQYLSEEEVKKHQTILTKGGIAAPLCWYRAILDDVTPAEERSMEFDPERVVLKKPVFFGAGRYDYVCIPEICIPENESTSLNAKSTVFDTDHWIMWAAPDELNKELLDWIENDVAKTCS